MSLLADDDLRGVYLVADRIGERFRIYQTTDRLWCTPEDLRAWCTEIIAEIDAKW